MAVLIAEHGWTPDYIDSLHPYWILVSLGWKTKNSRGTEDFAAREIRKINEARRKRQERRAQQPQATPYSE